MPTIEDDGIGVLLNGPQMTKTGESWEQHSGILGIGNSEPRNLAPGI